MYHSRTATPQSGSGVVERIQQSRKERCVEGCGVWEVGVWEGVWEGCVGGVCGEGVFVVERCAWECAREKGVCGWVGG